MSETPATTTIQAPPTPPPPPNSQHLSHPLCRYTRLFFPLDRITTSANNSSTAMTSDNLTTTTTNSYNNDNDVGEDTVIHGFVGYFDSLLFDPLHLAATEAHHNAASITTSATTASTVVCGSDVPSDAVSNTIGISINPESFSHGMFSWFPLFFPLQIPIHYSSLPTIAQVLKAQTCGESSRDNITSVASQPLLPPTNNNTNSNNNNNSELDPCQRCLEVEIWRKNDGRRVWYEYSVVGQGIIHNLNGGAYSNWPCQ
jgi:hypothetical protein